MNAETNSSLILFKGASLSAKAELADWAVAKNQILAIVAQGGPQKGKKDEMRTEHDFSVQVLVFTLDGQQKGATVPCTPDGDFLGFENGNAFDAMFGVAVRHGLKVGKENETPLNERPVPFPFAINASYVKSYAQQEGGRNITVEWNVAGAKSTNIFAPLVAVMTGHEEAIRRVRNRTTVVFTQPVSD